MTSDQITHAVEMLHASQVAVALTGAGISVASGIPDFRSPQGLWSEFEPMEYATIEAFIADPHKVWKMFKAVSRLVRAASPNAAHKALAELEQGGRLQAVITQNIDGLHQVAGTRTIVELHGTGRRLACPECGYQETTPEQGLPDQPVPCPHAAGHTVHRYLKPDVILFGEDLKRHAYLDFVRWQNSLDLLLIIGTSAEVYPAAALPSAVKALGARIIEINAEPTRITRTLTDCFLQGNAEQILPALAGRALG